MTEIVLLVLSVVSIGLTYAFKRPVKCEELRDAVKQEVITNEKATEVPALEE